jgi:hypothetical protein
MPLTLFISKHKVMLTITGVWLSASLVGSLVGLTVAINDIARVLVELQQAVPEKIPTLYQNL